MLTFLPLAALDFAAPCPSSADSQLVRTKQPVQASNMVSFEDGQRLVPGALLQSPQRLEPWLENTCSLPAPCPSSKDSLLVRTISPHHSLKRLKFVQNTLAFRTTTLHKVQST